VKVDDGMVYPANYDITYRANFSLVKIGDEWVITVCETYNIGPAAAYLAQSVTGTDLEMGMDDGTTLVVDLGEIDGEGFKTTSMSVVLTGGNPTDAMIIITPNIVEGYGTSKFNYSFDYSTWE
jgi:hypothetical protein